MARQGADVIGKGLDVNTRGVDNITLIRVNEAIRTTGVERIGKTLRAYMGAMKPIY
jgi:ketol-acid reductoisomerase